MLQGEGKSKLAVAAFSALTVVLSTPQVWATPYLADEAQPVIELKQTPMTIGQAGTGTAQSGESYATSTGVVYPEKGGGRQQPSENKMKVGPASGEEKAAWAKLGLKVDPRREIVALVNGVGRKDWPFAARGQLSLLNDSGLSVLAKRHVFYVLRYPQWPVGFDVPAPLSNNNIFAVDGAGKVHLITTVEQLKAFFARSAKVTDEETARSVLRAWLRLHQELLQDGMFQFDTQPTDVQFSQSQSTLSIKGKVSVAPVGGNSGAVSVRLSFDRPTGNLTRVEESVSLQEGMRPICQSTKLLDKDPIVRKMAEQDLLIMGKFAKPYLDWQRQRVSPDLQKAIDSVWQKILKENRYAEY